LSLAVWWSLAYIAPVIEQRGVHPLRVQPSHSPSADAAAPAEAASAPDWPPAQLPAGTVFGQLDIPSIGLSARVVELRSATDLTALLGAPGHLPGTALPGHANTSVIAAHNNTFFHRLDALKTGDEMLMTLPDGRQLLYRVVGARVIGASDSLLIHPTSPQLLLVTCYPLTDLLPTPNRYIVTASLVGAPLPPSAPY
jgi:sortase A